MIDIKWGKKTVGCHMKDHVNCVNNNVNFVSQYIVKSADRLIIITALVLPFCYSFKQYSNPYSMPLENHL